MGIGNCWFLQSLLISANASLFSAEKPVLTGNVIKFKGIYLLGQVLPSLGRNSIVAVHLFLRLFTSRNLAKAWFETFFYPSVKTNGNESKKGAFIAVPFKATVYPHQCALPRRGNISVEKRYGSYFCAVGAIYFSPLLFEMHIRVLHLRRKKSFWLFFYRYLAPNGAAFLKKKMWVHGSLLRGRQ